MPRTEAQKRWRRENREREREMDRVATSRRRRNNYPAFKWKEIKAGAVRRNLLFELSKEDVQTILARRFCEICGVETKQGGCESDRRTTPSIDRVDNASGYTVQNTALLCYRCNTQKGDMTLAEAERLVAWLRVRSHH
jgi:5-methylcytosine-specific restriction endonuclease McrA